MVSLPEMYLEKKCVLKVRVLKIIKLPDFPQLALTSLYDGMSKYSNI